MRVLIGVTASIAAYKAAEIVSELSKSGVDISVIMTEHATRLVGPETFRALSGNEVRVRLFDGGTTKPIHIDLAVGHDVIAIVPATANMIGKIAAGICDDLVSTVVLSTNVPVIIAPAMNEAMYLNPAVQQNIEVLKRRGYIFVDPEAGWLACGNQGLGRLGSIDRIVEAVMDAGSSSAELNGKKVLITGGPTREPIDAVRFISNRSSGKMAFSLARVARRRGADTVLITGPVGIGRPAGVRAIEVETTSQMREAVEREWEGADCIVMAAAVCDFRPEHIVEGKLKRRGRITLDLASTEDILRTLSSKKAGKMLVGFALETENEVDGGKRKLEEKNLDLVFVNNPLRKGSGFGADTNSGYLIHSDGRVEEFPLKTKLELSDRIFDAISARLADAC
jgi:phosphopantothenoylcysteine decarboxylase/phosphopantothenate--cysteine ligase